jgi:alcohol dehydrogenase (cytochrome c)
MRSTNRSLGSRALVKHRFGLAAASLAAAISLGALVPLGTHAASTSITFSSDQQSAGSKLFENTCATCHGSALEGGAGPPLSGQNFKTLGSKIGATVGDIFTYMSTNMPMNNPASLTHTQYVEIMAFILSKNGYHAGGAPLTYATAESSKAKPYKD